MGQTLTIAIAKHGKGAGENLVITADADLKFSDKGQGHLGGKNRSRH